MPVIYKIVNPQGKVYIGQTWDVTTRASSYKNLHCSRQLKLYNSLKKYSWDNHTFEIVHILPGDVKQEVLDRYEIFYWQQYKDLSCEMLNLKEPGSKGKHSESTKLLFSEIRRGKVSGHKGKFHTEATKQKIGNVHRGKVVSAETREKISTSSKGKKMILRTCPYCNLTGGGGAMTQWHFKNCKNKLL
jgi:group I intron endonuclease